MIIKTIIVELDNLIDKLYQIGIHRVDMIVPKCSDELVVFEIYYWEKVWHERVEMNLDII